MAIRPKKSLGQHFLSDRNMIEKIVRSIPFDLGLPILEIGPGPGAITAYLFEESTSFLAVEVDPRAVSELTNKYKGIKILQKDILKVEWPEILNHISFSDNKSEKIVVVGNLPYYITSPILFRLLEWSETIDQAIVMMQKEVADRLVANIKTKAYGILSVQFQLFADVEYLFTVPPTVFHPPPKVDSAVVRIRFNNSFSLNEQQNIRKIVRLSFSQRRKKLKNNLKTQYSSNQLEQLPYADNVRAEELSPQEFADMTKILMQTDSL